VYEMIPAELEKDFEFEMHENMHKKEKGNWS
jgi:hypothetical protein